MGVTSVAANPEMICSSLNLLRFIPSDVLRVGFYSKSVTFQGSTSTLIHQTDDARAAGSEMGTRDSKRRTVKNNIQELEPRGQKVAGYRQGYRLKAIRKKGYFSIRKA